MYTQRKTHWTHVFINSQLLCILQAQFIIKKFTKYNTLRPTSSGTHRIIISTLKIMNYSINRDAVSLRAQFTRTTDRREKSHNPKQRRTVFLNSNNYFSTSRVVVFLLFSYFFFFFYCSTLLCWRRITKTKFIRSKLATNQTTIWTARTHSTDTQHGLVGDYDKNTQIEKTLYFCKSWEETMRRGWGEQATRFVLYDSVFNEFYLKFSWWKTRYEITALYNVQCIYVQNDAY